VKERLARALAWLPRPLDPVRSIKMKIIMVLLAGGGSGLIWFYLWLGWFPFWTGVTASVIGVTIVQFLARGMTSPLREMTAAARDMAQGDYTRRIRATSADEVGELAAAFNQMSSDLAAADRQRRELIANVSHELRTPITALQGLLENIVDGVAAAEPVMMQTALAQTERLGRLVTELLDLSRLDAGAVALRPEIVEVADLVADAVAEAEVTADVSGRGVTFAIDVAPADLAASVDRARLHQVLINLLDNAARHSPPSGTVTVLARPEGEQLTIEVHDQGPGIAAADRERVFHRFTRGERPVGGGTGLGLAIARWAVELHGGRIAVVQSPDPQPSSRIRVTVPGLPA